ncbi:hypothetical protein MIMGU_mgv1a021160mg [Erythranthe guttata]|uniref:Transcription factor CBF/NF-Y/archaeal histone domain-containing protein n=1 Tax=Erythranthe guttata TaxID=4155 RepID=A0A022RH61_ERYGU|nr:hypothetical protein MIMGU_mgv1a021160mg [Erythranthe guttata]
MPIANITRTMRRVLPAHARITDDAKEAIQECVSEFISFITVEANMRCHRDYRKTVTPEDVLAAMKSLGFDDYLQPLAVFLNKRDNNAAVGGGFVHHHQQQQQQQGAQMVRPPPPPPTAPTMWYYAPLSLPPAASVEDEEKIGGSQR